MAIYNIGNLIRHRREELELTQEELSEGICSVATLSRIENGSYAPTRPHIQALLQRLGYSEADRFIVTSDQEFRIADLQYNCRYAFIRQDYETARELLGELEKLKDKFSSADDQFYALMYINTHRKDFTDTEALERFEDAMKMTHPSYSRDNLPKVLTYEEATALNNIAICLDALGSRDRSIRMWYYIKDYYSRKIVEAPEALRILPGVLYNLSKALGMSGQYDECIEVCDEGIRIARENGRCLYLAYTMYNRAWSLVKRGRPEDMEDARSQLNDAYLVSRVMTVDPAFMGRIRDFLEKNFNEGPNLS